MSLKNLPDAKERQQALDITRSFIVQAPAGSGKTELLTRRFVHLLEHSVQDPEEIIAITFTRKAAAEMRHRVMSLLPACHSHRLRIMTIDAFCKFLCTQIPLKSRLNQQFRLSDYPDNLYETAIENLFLYHQESFLEDFLLYLDNDPARVKALLREILKNRDQWLPHIFNINAIDALEQGLQNAISETLSKSAQFMPVQQLEKLLAYTSNIAALFLTKQDTVRKKLPAGFAEISPEFEAHLRDLHYLPPESYTVLQKKFILALSMILPLLTAELQLVFKDTGEYDFIEVGGRKFPYRFKPSLRLSDQTSFN
jgi:ATP-dependent helicase/nuclease subunit A